MLRNLQVQNAPVQHGFEYMNNTRMQPHGSEEGGGYSESEK